MNRTHAQILIQPFHSFQPLAIAAKPNAEALSTAKGCSGLLSREGAKSKLRCRSRERDLSTSSSLTDSEIGDWRYCRMSSRRPMGSEESNPTAASPRSRPILNRVRCGIRNSTFGHFINAADTGRTLLSKFSDLIHLFPLK